MYSFSNFSYVLYLNLHALVHTNRPTTMFFPSNTTVLIIGAGPAGMACAISLLLSGVKDIVIVDASDDRKGDLSSRAFVLHAATLEALDLLGCANTLVERGIKISAMNYYDRSDNYLLGVDFNGLIGKTHLPFCLLIPQYMTEATLTQKLEDVGISPFWSYKAVGMHENSKDGRLVDVSFENGQSITTRYVIGADGPRSTIRELSGIGFTDPRSAPDQPEVVNTLAQMVVADITFDGEPFIQDTFYAVLSPNNFCAVAHLEHRSPTEGSKDAQGKTIYRFACGIPLSEGEPPSKASVEYCQQLIDKYGARSLSSDKSKNPHAIRVTDVLWSTRFRTRHAAAETFFKRFSSSGSEAGSSGASVCLIGDAAHIHPPAGGQGMNLGLRDGISLGPVIAAALTAGPSSESDERVRAHMALRRERAVKVIGITKLMAGTMGMSPAVQAAFSWSPININTIRDWAFWALGKSKWIRETLAYQISGLENR